MERLTFGLSSLACLLLACGGEDGEGNFAAYPPPPWMDQKVEDQAHTADANAQRAGDMMHAASYGEGVPPEWLVHLEAGNCYWFSGTGSEKVERLYLFLWDPSKDRVINERASSPTVLTRFCPKVTGPYRMQVKTAGKGFVAFGLYAVAGQAPPPPVATPTPAPAPAPAPALDLSALVDQQAASAAPGATRVGALFTGAGDRSEWAVALTANTCYWFIGVGEPNRVRSLNLYVWDPRQKRVTESRNESSVAVAGTCVSAPGMYKFQAKVQSGSGAYKVGLYAKPQ